MKNKPFIVLFLSIVLAVSFVCAADYTRTNKKDFDVYIDPAAELSGFVYGTVKIDTSTYPGEDFKCVTDIFFFNGTTNKLMHVQSNPPHSPQDRMVIFSTPTTSPETLGYFPTYNGIGNIYYRSKDIIAYNNFTLVVLCNSNQSQLVYEENINPVYKAAFKDLPSRGVWFAQSDNADMIIIVGAVLFIAALFIFYKFTR